MSLILLVTDGPLAGESFTVDRCPRQVRLVVNEDGKGDVLNLPEDEPEEGETVHWYEWDETRGHVCIRHGKGRGCYSTAGLRYLGAQEAFPEPRAEDCAHGCCKAGDVGVCSEAVRPAPVGA